MATIAQQSAGIFIETGTYYGSTTKWASAQFRKVFTIELSAYLYNLTKDELLSKGNITPILGDSRIVLPQILKTIDSNAVFWLDGHYSAGVTAGIDDPCPLPEELKIILQRNNDDIILIDDARCCANKEEGWPTVVEICRIVKENERQNKRHIQLCNDHIYIIPDKDKYKEILIEYILDQDILLWQLYSQIKSKEESFKKGNGPFNFLKSIFRKFVPLNVSKNISKNNLCGKCTLSTKNNKLY
jgi:hypothetical protein